jgi:hypothetical protein
MIPLFVFYIHIVGASAAFTKRWQEEGLGEGILAVLFVSLLFFVGWSITSFILRLAISKEGFGPALDRDAASLLLLTVSEAVFYYFYLRKDHGKTPASSTD